LFDTAAVECRIKDLQSGPTDSSTRHSQADDGDGPTTNITDGAGDAAQTDGVDALITDATSKVCNLSVAFDHTRIRVLSCRHRCTAMSRDMTAAWMR